jgi:hypothetical protein
MKTYSKPVIELIDLQAVGFIMGLEDASNPNHTMTSAPKRRWKIF